MTRLCWLQPLWRDSCKKFKISPKHPHIIIFKISPKHFKILSKFLQPTFKHLEKYLQLTLKYLQISSKLLQTKFVSRWVAAFSISAYGSSNAQASHKPFNPLLGETFECIREDKGFRYIAEQVFGVRVRFRLGDQVLNFQVSHHPPISGVQADGAGWTWSQVTFSQIENSGKM